MRKLEALGTFHQQGRSMYLFTLIRKVLDTIYSHRCLDHHLEKSCHHYSMTKNKQDGEEASYTWMPQEMGKDLSTTATRTTISSPIELSTTLMFSTLKRESQRKPSQDYLEEDLLPIKQAFTRSKHQNIKWNTTLKLSTNLTLLNTRCLKAQLKTFRDIIPNNQGN